MIAQLYTFVKNHWIVHLLMVYPSKDFRLLEGEKISQEKTIKFKLFLNTWPAYLLLL